MVYQRYYLEKPDSKIFGRLTIQIDFERGAKFTIEGGEVCSVYDTKIMRWQHLNFLRMNAI